jgi:hypothetical protein
MMPHLKLATGGSVPPSPARATLAAAIAAVRGAEAEAEKAATAVSRAGTMVETAETALAEADAAVNRARDGLAARLTAAATSGRAAEAADDALRSARARHAEATDTLEAARSALRAVGEAEERVRTALEEATRRRDAAANAVLIEGAEQLLAEAISLRDQMVRAACALNFMRRCASDDDAGLTARIDQFLATPLGPDGFATALSGPLAAPVIEPWRQALDDLRRNANAPLPGAA